MSTCVNTFNNMSNYINYNGYESDNSDKLTNLTDLTDSIDSIDSTDSTDSISLISLNDFTSSNNYQDKNVSSNYYGRNKWSRSRTKQQQHQQHQYIKQISDSSNESNNCELCSTELGYTSNLTKDTPFIKFLIDRRINFCQLGASSHIAAFVPVSFNFRWCFIHNGKWKSRYR